MTSDLELLELKNILLEIRREQEKIAVLVEHSSMRFSDLATDIEQAYGYRRQSVKEYLERNFEPGTDWFQPVQNGAIYLSWSTASRLKKHYEQKRKAKGK